MEAERIPVFNSKLRAICKAWRLCYVQINLFNWGQLCYTAGCHAIAEVKTSVGLSSPIQNVWLDLRIGIDMVVV